MESVGGVAWLLDEPPDPATFLAPGWVVRPLGEGSAPGARRTLLVGTVSGTVAAAVALEAAAMGSTLGLYVTLAGSDRQRFLEDLSRLGVEVRAGMPEPPRPTDEQIELLELLVSGVTVTAAAAYLNVSRRTTNRMLSEIRELLGVDSNAQAVKEWVVRRTQP